MNQNNHIPLYSDTSPDWHTDGQKQPYAVDLNVGVNEYIFGRTTPDNKFVVSTGLVNKPLGVEMTGAGKVKTKEKKDGKTKQKNETKPKQKDTKTKQKDTKTKQKDSKTKQKDSKTKQRNNSIKKALIKNCKKDINKKTNTFISATELFLKKISEYSSSKSNPNLNNAIKSLKTKKSKDKIKKMIIKKCNEIGR